MSLFDTLNRIEVDETRPIDAPVCDAEAFYDVVRSRRSIRRFTGEPIPDEVFDRVIEAALMAPNSSNLQPWEFIRVRDPDLKAKVAHAAMGQPAATTASEILVCVARWGTWREHRDALMQAMRGESLPQAVKDYYGKIVPITWANGPLSALGWGRWAMSRALTWVRPVPQFNPGGLYPQIVAIKSCALACENLMLAWRAEGYDTCPMEGFDARRVARLVGLQGGGWEIVMLVGVGHRAAGGVYGRQVRLPRDRVVRTL
jgi:nitroreductase